MLPDFVAIANAVAREMGLDRGIEADHSPPIIFMENAHILAERFPVETERRKTPFFLGYCWDKVIYLSQPDISDTVIAHEFAHWFGADEARAVEVSETLYGRGQGAI